jgi:hypothetical protein
MSIEALSSALDKRVGRIKRHRELIAQMSKINDALRDEGFETHFLDVAIDRAVEDLDQEERTNEEHRGSLRKYYPNWFGAPEE